MTGNACEDCKWFDSSTHARDIEGGFCRVLPPAVDKRTGAARWPTVGYDDWCSQFDAQPNVGGEEVATK
jgi:hypothetical protein